MLTRRRNRRFAFETLESRQVFAGNVFVSLVNGDLIITGGPNSNGIQIVPGSDAGTVEVSGLMQAGNRTKLNHDTQPLTFVVEHDIILDLRDGDDLVQIDGLQLPGNLKADLGTGSDVLTMSNTTVQQAVVLSTGDGDDQVTFQNDQFGGNIQADLGNHDDYFTMLGSHAFGSVSLDTGDNADHVVMDGSQFDYNLSITGHANRTWEKVSLSNLQVRQNLIIQDKEGRCSVRLAGISAGAIKLAGGRLGDHVELSDINTGSLTIGLGDDNDRLSLAGVTATNTKLDGGRGTDQLLQPAANALGTFRIDRFEQ
jgi:hypothetical protein